MSPRSDQQISLDQFLLTARQGSQNYLDIIRHYTAAHQNDAAMKNHCEQALLLAASNGLGGVVQALLAVGGININVQDQQGCTPLILAAIQGHVAVVSVLLKQQGVDLNAVGLASVRCTALTGAIINRHTAIVRALLQAGADPNLAPGDGGKTPLMLAVCPQPTDVKQNTEMIDILFASPKINLNAVNKDGDTVLMVAIKEGLIVVVNKLLNLGIDTSIVNHKGETARTIADNNLPIKQLFIERNYPEKIERIITDMTVAASGFHPLASTNTLQTLLDSCFKASASYLELAQQYLHRVQSSDSFTNLLEVFSNLLATLPCLLDGKNNSEESGSLDSEDNAAKKAELKELVDEVSPSLRAVSALLGNEGSQRILENFQSPYLAGIGNKLHLFSLQKKASLQLSPFSLNGLNEKKHDTDNYSVSSSSSSSSSSGKSDAVIEQKNNSSILQQSKSSLFSPNKSNKDDEYDESGYSSTCSSSSSSSSSGKMTVAMEQENKSIAPQQGGLSISSNKIKIKPRKKACFSLSQSNHVPPKHEDERGEENLIPWLRSGTKRK